MWTVEQILKRIKHLVTKKFITLWLGLGYGLVLGMCQISDFAHMNHTQRQNLIKVNESFASM